MPLPRFLSEAAARMMSRGIVSADGRPIQTGALPWRRNSRGEIEILLVTGRASPRWLPPKGWPMRGKSLAAAAAQEAFEEAGVEGEVGETPIGEFDHLKQRAPMGPIDVRIRLYPLKVRRVLDDWPEREERSRRWFTPQEAVAVVPSRVLGQLIGRFTEPRSDK